MILSNFIFLMFSMKDNIYSLESILDSTKNITGFSNYGITESGDLYNLKTGRKLKLNAKGRYYLVSDDGKSTSRSKQSLLTLAFPDNTEFIPDLEGEVWKPIGGTKGLYYVSNMGRIKSLQRNVPHLLKPQKNYKGYERVELSVKGQVRRTELVSRLVAYAFLPPPPYKTMCEQFEVHHIDHNKQNNRADNLVWLARSEHKKMHTGSIDNQKRLENECIKLKKFIGQTVTM